MRRSALLAAVLAPEVLATAVLAAVVGGGAPVRAEYYCSPGFVPSHGRCIATAATDQVDLYLNEPGSVIHEDAPPVSSARRRHRRHALRTHD